ncbi:MULTISPECIES: pyridoxal 5'-phosphate synthase glutaminase subunit PdxT [Corynebacterium]|uniref:pyridoxal 5'-phosphate synthase glutaminase subunit PdxT n=1 Tax=unclassified Corynebacterium TaxID=2624378 RepID=UPI001CE45A71|nr:MULTISPECIES: pyridoxal 5'-phosphate synthase glutaminase subunit PdxT [Corynebacterium]
MAGKPVPAASPDTAPVIGVLSLQGGVEEHLAILEQLGAHTRRVRLPKDLDGLDGLILPGGESTVFDKLARTFELAEPLKAAIERGLPTLATCAGLIYAARELENPASGQQTLGVLNVTVRRNAFGSQRNSSERILTIDGETVESSFIRAPIVTAVGDGVEVLASTQDADEEDVIVAVRQGHITAVSFHPEENGETTLHAAWLRGCRS